jgi:N-acetylglucosaminyltransferase
MRATTVAVVLALYLALATVYARLQRRFAELGHRPRAAPSPSPYLPSVDVIVPCYNEEPALLAACLWSLRMQDYQGEVRVWVVDDGSVNRDAVLPVLRAETGLHQVLLLNGNHGKRQAQAAVLCHGRGDVLVTVDSDTVIAPDGIRRIVAPLRESSVGAVTGNLRASNAGATWLTRLIDIRYQLIFGRERAAQGLFGTVLALLHLGRRRRRGIAKWRRFPSGRL